MTMEDRTLTKQVESFFREYNDTFKTIDGRRIATLYHAPSLTLRGDGTFLLLDTQEAIEKFFQKVAETYSGEGYADGAFTNLTVVPIGGRSALATMDWTLLRRDGTPIREWRQSYNLLRTPDGWKIILSTFHVA